jgi:hypothetical protein
LLALSRTLFLFFVLSSFEPNCFGVLPLVDQFFTMDGMYPLRMSLYPLLACIYLISLFPLCLSTDDEIAKLQQERLKAEGKIVRVLHVEYYAAF